MLRAPSVRLLPILIFATVGMLGFRIELVVETIAHARKSTLQLTQPQAFAQSEPAKADAKSADAQPQDGAAAPPATDEKHMDGEPGKEAAGGDQPKSGFDPSTLTKSEIDTLQRLAERREIIEKRERDLTAREGLLAAGEARIDGKITELHDLEKTIEGLLKKYDVQKQAEIDSLVKIYGAMKPKDAASIFDNLDMPILLSVVQNMKEAKVAPIMALMSREKARMLTEELSQRKQIGQQGG